jgi:hypothetical protein
MQQLMRKFSIRFRMIGAIGVVLSLLVFVGSIGLFGMHVLSGQSRQFIENSMAEANEMGQLIGAMGDMRRYEKDMIINYEKPEEVKKYRALWDKARASFTSTTKKMLEGEEDIDNPILRKLEPLIKGYTDKATPILAQVEAGAYDTATVAKSTTLNCCSSNCARRWKTKPSRPAAKPRTRKTWFCWALPWPLPSAS